LIQIPLAKPHLVEEDFEAVSKILKSGMLVQGKEVLQLESNFRNFTSATNASAVSNGTASLHLALVALGINRGDEVIVPALSYIASANVIELVGAKPVFVDVIDNEYTIDPSKIEEAITSKTKALICVHEFGLAAHMDELLELCNTNKIPIIEDAACALGSHYKGAHVGTFGDYGSFSLHPRKAITSGEGGMLITNFDIHDEKIKVLRNHGISKDGQEFVSFGFNYRLTDIQAALVNTQFRRIERNLASKRHIAENYLKHIESERISMPFVPENFIHSWQSFHVTLPFSISREETIEKLKEKGIQSNYGAQCIPATKAFFQKYQLDSSKLFPNALKAFKQGLVLPVFESMTEEQINYVITNFNEILNDKK